MTGTPKMNIFKIFSFFKKNKKIEPEKEPIDEVLDPLDKRHYWEVHEQKVNSQMKAVELKSVSDYPVGRIQYFNTPGIAQDGSSITHEKMQITLDSYTGNGQTTAGFSTYDSYIPQGIQAWYATQTFIGYQNCAIIAQHWLVNKACTMVGEDAMRNGYDYDFNSDEVDTQTIDKIKEYDKFFKINENCVEFMRFTNIFGIRVTLFNIESDDPQFYEKPFNPDGITPGSYKGISQIDPYWMTPVLSDKSAGDPSYQDFYQPEWWIINGRKIHKSHLVIGKTAEPADILKPTYIFGGVPLTQQIYERVYAAERTANEGPMLAMTKRTTAIHVDVKKAFANQGAFEKRLQQSAAFRDNYQVRVLGQDETMEQFDTALTDLDSVIMTQYQLVAAIAKVPSTKLLGTSPKGFNATGEFEMKNYHEELESVQQKYLAPFINRHHLCLSRSEFSGLDLTINIAFNPVDSRTDEELANINKLKMDTDAVAIQNGAISPDESRKRLIADKDSGYTGLTDEEVSTLATPRGKNYTQASELGEKDDSSDNDSF